VNVERVSIGGFSLPVLSTATVSPTRDAGAPEADGAWGTLARDRISEAWGRSREWAAERLLVAGTTLKRRDHARWQRAESVQDLCDLTVRWLRGEIPSQPGYYGPVDVDEDDAPGLTDALMALNRIGFWSRTSQAGADGEGTTARTGPNWPQSRGSLITPLSSTWRTPWPAPRTGSRPIPPTSRATPPWWSPAGKGRPTRGSAEVWTTRTSQSRSPA
jgi:hypothetical protein